MKQQLLERFLHYVQCDTQASEESTAVPSTVGQLTFAKKLYEECLALGLTEVTLDANGYVMASLPSNIKKDIPTIGFIAHMDTSPDNSGVNVNPQVITYLGETLTLGQSDLTLNTTNTPILKQLIGETLITTDGTTLLGADDKCGIAEIMTAMSYFITHPEIPHGKIRIGFTPDEEVGRGADHFDVEAFGATFAYTVDGGELGELEAENFNAGAAKVIIKGHNIHPGYAKNKMKNSITLAKAFDDLLPHHEVPECTSHYEGFFHLHHMSGNVEETTLDYIIRDFDKASYEKRKSFLLDCGERLNKQYGAGTVQVILKDQYANMKVIIDENPSIMTLAEQAMQTIGIVPHIVPIRGGTDGARLSFMGLPCPNLFTGGYNFHSKNEFAVLGHMEKALFTIIEIVKLHAQMNL